MSYRELPEILKEKAKEEINEDPKRTKDDLNFIKDWLKKNPYLNVRQDDQWLLGFLRGCKFSLERTKEKLDLYYTVRSVVPEFFSDRDPRRPEVQRVLRNGVILPLWKSSDSLAPRIILLRGGSYDPKAISPIDIFKTNMMLMDIAILEDEYAPVNGIRIVQDMGGTTMAHMASPALAKKAMTCFQDAYPNRIKSIHFINIPNFFEMIFSIFRPFMNEKMKTRLNIHTVDDIESLYKTVPKEMLPKEYGGENDSVQEIIDAVLKKVEEYRDWFIDDEKYKTIEQLRPGKPKTSDEMFGIEGSFRKLDVD